MLCFFFIYVKIISMKKYSSSRAHTDALLDRVMKKSGITTDSELADLLNIGKSNVSNYRNGRNNLGTLTLIRCWAIDGESWAIRALVELRKHDSSSATERRVKSDSLPAGYDRRNMPSDDRSFTDADESEWCIRAMAALANTTDQQ